MKRVELQEQQGDGGQQERDVEMDMPYVQGPQGTDVQLEFLPSTSQVASDDDLALLAVPGELDSIMVRDEQNSSDYAALDAQINANFPYPTLADDPTIREIQLRSILLGIAQQNNIKVSDKIFEGYHWLQGLLLRQFEDSERSFTKVRHLSECPLYTVPVNSIT